MSFFQHIPSREVLGTSGSSLGPPPKDSSINKNKTIIHKNTFMRELAPVQAVKKEQNKKKSSVSPKSDTPNKIEVDVTKTTGDGSPNIIFIDEQIKRDLRDKSATLTDLYNRLYKLIWIVQNSKDHVDVIQASKETTIMRKRIQDIESGFEYSLYILRTADMLEEYKTLFEATSSASFIKTFMTRDETKIHRRNELLLDYMRIAKEYINLENYKQKATKPICESCHSTKLLATGEGESILVCECGNTLEQLDDAPTFKDSERVNMSSRYTYTCRGHLVEAMNRFEGKQNTEIDESVVDMLKKEVSLHQLTSDTATKDHIYMFMTEKKLSDYYADINLIYFKITAKNPPDITNYRSELLEMHDQLEEAYMEVKDEERLNSLNVNWKLYKLLQLLGYDCKKDDFFCLKTPTKQGEHEQKWFDMIEYLQQKYPTSFTSNGARRWRHVRTS
jgi:hypothetical protein